MIHPDDEISIDVPLFARRLGNREIMATFSSDETTSAETDTTVFVISKSEWKEEEEKEEEKEKEEMETDAGGAGDAAEADMDKGDEGDSAEGAGDAGQGASEAATE